MLPSSTTSGGAAAGAAIELGRVVRPRLALDVDLHVRYAAVKRPGAAATTVGQPVFASVCSQTVKVPLAAAGVEAPAVAAESEAPAGVEPLALFVDFELLHPATAITAASVAAVS